MNKKTIIKCVKEKKKNEVTFTAEKETFTKVSNFGKVSVDLIGGGCFVPIDVLYQMDLLFRQI